MVKVQDLKIGSMVNYGFFKGVKYKGLSDDGKEVILEDKNGNQKNVFVSLFEKYGKKGGGIRNEIIWNDNKWYLHTG